MENIEIEDPQRQIEILRKRLAQLQEIALLKEQINHYNANDNNNNNNNNNNSQSSIPQNISQSSTSQIIDENATNQIIDQNAVPQVIDPNSTNNNSTIQPTKPVKNSLLQLLRVSVMSKEEYAKSQENYAKATCENNESIAHRKRATNNRVAQDAAEANKKLKTEKNLRPCNASRWRQIYR